MVCVYSWRKAERKKKWKDNHRDRSSSLSFSLLNSRKRGRTAGWQQHHFLLCLILHPEQVRGKIATSWMQERRWRLQNLTKKKERKKSRRRSVSGPFETIVFLPYAKDEWFFVSCLPILRPSVPLWLWFFKRKTVKMFASGKEEKSRKEREE